MAQVEQKDSGKGGKKTKQKKVTLRVDFTPMVDMNMLLITFFMFCTTLSKPQTMELAMPDKNNIPPEELEKHMVKPDLALTIVLGEGNKVYYYEGKPNYDDYTSLKETDFSDNGIRQVLLRRNDIVVKQVNALKMKKKNGEISEDDYKVQVAEAKKDKRALVVMIRPMDTSTYDDMVNALDEMLICNVGKYTIGEFTEVEDFLVKNLQTKGQAAK